MNNHNFDDFAKDYDSVLANSIPTHLNDNVYFSEYKIALALRLMKTHTITNILDFGCGSGRSLPFLEKYFPQAQLFGYDPSIASLQIAKQRALPVQLVSDINNLPCNHFDLIVAANVFHHILPEERLSALNKCKELLTENGSLIIFEHNPINPLTRWIFDHCPFDIDAEMISMKRMKSLINDAHLLVDSQGYTMFFPKQLSCLRKLEPSLKHLPMGAQYYVQITK